MLQPHRPARPPMTARELLADCSEFLRVRVVPSDDMGSYEVVLTLAAGFDRPADAMVLKQALARAVADVIRIEGIGTSSLV